MHNRSIIVAGGGMVGATAALLLGKAGFQVSVIEPVTPRKYSVNDEMDLRVSAISRASVELLKSAGVWDKLSEMRVCPYKRLQTWESGSEKLKFDAQDLGCNELGYIVENRLIQLAVWQELKLLSNVRFYCPNKIVALQNTAKVVTVTLDNGDELAADLLLAADGANSQVRQLAGIGITCWDYRQHCMLVSIKTDVAQQDITWQEFSPTGPRAFLPLAGQSGSLVWYHSPQKIKRLSELDNQALAKAIRDEFAELPFNFEVQGKGAFPLTRRHAQQYVKDRVVLLGDAAHTINPLAGQGVNLGFKDVACLVEQLGSVGEGELTAQLSRYEKTRRPDNLFMQTAMDVFYKGFSSDLAPVKVMRQLGLKLAENAGPLKNKVLKYAMGL